MAKYFYKDKETSELKKYIGDIKERDGKLYGTLVTSNTEYSISELTQIDAHEKIDSFDTYLAWKDKEGNVHELTDEDMVKDNKVIVKYENELPIIYHPEIPEKIYFIRKDTNELFKGEIIEEDGKYYGKLKGNL